MVRRGAVQCGQIADEGLTELTIQCIYVLYLFLTIRHGTKTMSMTFPSVQSSVVFIAYWVGLPYYVENKSWGLLYSKLSGLHAMQY